MKCKICDYQITSFFDTAIVLRKYEATYYQCNNCGFIQVQDPFWLEEAYSNPISQSDIGLVGRNLINVELTKMVITLFFNRQGEFLDYGGGYGLFVRIMRDKGFDFYLYEPNCENLFANSFDIKLPANVGYHMTTAFEVFEHLRDPLAEVDQMLRLSPNLFFSTTLLPSPPPKPSQWWYYSLEGGQHISLYTRQSLRCMADRLGMRIYTDGKNYHLLTSKKIPLLLYALVTRVRISRFINLFIRMPSLLSHDYQKIVGRPLE